MTSKVLTLALFLITATSSFAIENGLMGAFPVKEQVRLSLWYQGLEADKKAEQSTKKEHYLPIELIHPLNQWNISKK